MFWSKIWFFLIAVAGTAALAIALVLPRPAERRAIVDEERRLADACAVTNILLTDNARVRIDLAGDFARFPSVSKILDSASKTKSVSADLNRTAQTAADELLSSVTGSIKPAFVYMLDANGRVVARAGKQAHRGKYDDTLAGYHLVDDALNGYLRDDLWLVNNQLYRVAAAPVVHREVGVRDRYAGAVVLGHAMDKDLADSLHEQVRFNVSFYVGGSPVANSTSVQLHKDVLDHFAALETGDRDRLTDCAENKPFTVTSGSDEYAVVVARLPGEAAAADAFYAVYVKRPKAIGFLGTLDAVDGHDMGFDHFPWIPLGGLLLVTLGLGVFLMIWEADRPLRRLAADAVKLAKGDKDRLDEDRHRGKFGSIARSVNIQLDKQEREARAAKKDLDQLLGPAPEDSLAGAPNPLPAAGPGSAFGDDDFKPPPPSEFKFKDSSPKPAAPSGFDLDLPPPPGEAPKKRAPDSSPTLQRPTDDQIPPAPVSLPGGGKSAPPPIPKPPPMPRAVTPPPTLEPGSFDDDILGSPEPEPEPEPEATPEPPARPPSDFDAPTRVADPSKALLEQSADAGAADNGESTYQKVYDDFIALKKKCGESTASLTYEKFSAKLRKNRQALIDKHGCKEVKFQVYIKDGKAALKATPVKG